MSDRRTFLQGLVASVTIPAAVSAQASDAVEPDADLIALGHQWACSRELLDAAWEEHDAAADRYGDGPVPPPELFVRQSSMSDRRTLGATRSAIFDMESEVTGMANLASCMRIMMERKPGADERFQPAITELAYRLEHQAHDALAAWKRAFEAMTNESAETSSPCS